MADRASTFCYGMAAGILLGIVIDELQAVYEFNREAGPGQKPAAVIVAEPLQRQAQETQAPIIVPTIP